MGRIHSSKTGSVASRPLSSDAMSASIFNRWVAILGDLLALPTLSTLKDWITVIGAVLALPTAVLAVYVLMRYWKAKIRKEGSEQADIEKEKAYLAAFQSYLDELNRPLGYSEKEYTAPEGVLVQQELVELRYVFRDSSPRDQKGLSPRDIISGGQGTSVRNIDSLLRKTRRPVVLLGEPGCGKSVTMRHLALELARRQSGLKVWPTLPIYVQLGNYHQNDGHGEPVNLLEFIRYQLGNVIPGGLNILQVLDGALAQGRVFVLLDGMDEMPSKDFASRADKIKSFLVEYGTLDPVVIACRRREYSGTFPHSELIIEPFSVKRIREYLEKHWELYAKAKLSPEVQETARKNYLAIADEDHPFFPFATNPFSLKLLANYFFANNGTLPPSQAEVFESYIGKKLAVECERRKWLATKQVAVLNVWKEAAFRVIEANLGTYITADQAANMRGLKKRSLKEINEAFEVAVKSGLMRGETDGSVRFEHHRLLEYLAASYWEEAGHSLELTAEQLKNPWWREALVLRGGITGDPNELVHRVCRAIDRKYLGLLGLRFTDEPDEDRGPVIDSATLRLEGIVTIEAALICAGQRIRELNQGTLNLLEPLTLAIANNGSLIEQVRLARSLKGMPLSLSHRALSELAKSSSDWLVNDVFNAIDQKDYTDPRFVNVLNNFLRATSQGDLLTRLRAVKGLSLVSCWRLAQPELRRGLVRAGLKFMGFWLLILGMIFVSGKLFDPERLARENLSTSAGRWTTVAAVLTLLASSILLAGARLTISLSVCAVICCWLLPLRTAFRFIFVLWFYNISIGDEFKRAKWIRNPAVRFISLANGLSVLTRVLLNLLLFQALIVYGVWLTTYGPSKWLWHGLGALAGALSIELLLQLGHRRATRKILARGATTLEREKVELFLDECLDRLRNPMPARFSKQILNRIVEMPIDENIAIQKLTEFAAREEFFVRRDNILEAIDRIDLRRRQKALEDAYGAKRLTPHA